RYTPMRWVLNPKSKARNPKQIRSTNAGKLVSLALVAAMLAASSADAQPRRLREPATRELRPPPPPPVGEGKDATATAPASRPAEFPSIREALGDRIAALDKDLAGKIMRRSDAPGGAAS